MIKKIYAVVSPLTGTELARYNNESDAIKDCKESNARANHLSRSRYTAWEVVSFEVEA